ncbi:ornithine carbamoyltransferase [Rhodospirillum rubrum]|uniref:ornithine carbamoyltransferase n=1 Tax=Rhodospirillum rubrum TaxID=1085 RepID=UPI001908EB0B|nr:ornithine carbamoyltransferase [Rhodospirillum rubrum]MBK1666076.1 ornithine carbamoyltransferase [Rhodospirillum rubrum]MBK1678202.1 ornithine carbamoyltransferase [Rhodospirillum rubrum]
MTVMKTPRHFLELSDFDASALRAMLDRGLAFKAERRAGVISAPLAGKTLALIFEKPSTRTRVSFEVGMRQLGGSSITLSPADTQLGRGETIADTARVLSRYVDGIMLRTNDPAKLRDLSQNASVPVINGLTDAAHPCQIMADLMTFEEHRGSIKGKVVTWVGDGNNVACSWIKASALFGFTMRLACPAELEPPQGVLDWARANGGSVEVLRDPQEAVVGADCVVTDTWVSMGCDAAAARHALLRPYQVTAPLMAAAATDALFMHCLPAHRGEEVTEDVIDGPQSVVWDEAENRLHAQKGILAWCMAGS